MLFVAINAGKEENEDEAARGIALDILENAQIKPINRAYFSYDEYIVITA